MASEPTDPRHRVQIRSLGMPELISRAREGDRAARDELCQRCVPALRTWAAGRLPRQSRPLLSTLDLVHESVVAALSRLEQFEDRREGALMAYLRTCVLNRIRDEYRRARVRPESEDLSDDHPDAGPSPLEVEIGREAHDRYLRGLQALNERYAEAVVLHVEMGYGLSELARALGAPTEHAARMTLRRALEQLARVMADES